MHRWIISAQRHGIGKDTWLDGNSLSLRAQAGKVTQPNNIQEMESDAFPVGRCRFGVDGETGGALSR